MKVYPEYKRTGELWLQSVPSHWEMRKIKYLFTERSEKGYPNEPLLVASQNMGVVPKSVYGNRTVEAQKDLHLLKLVCIGDFVISLRSFQGGIEYAYYQGIISPAYTIMISKGIISNNYFKYLAKSRLFIELLQMSVTGIREGQNIDYFRLKNHLIPIPTDIEQDKIVKYLDWQSSRINKLINAKKKQIALLEEKKQTIISLSILYNIECLDDKLLCDSFQSFNFTSNFKFIRGKFLFEEIDNRSSTGTEELLSVSHITGITPRSQKNITMFMAESLVGYKLCEVGHIASNTMWMWQGAIGVSKYKGIVSPSYNIYRQITNNYIDEYLDYLLRTKQMINYYTIFSKGIRKSRLRLYPDSFLNIKFPVPTINEQLKIVQFIKSNINILNSMIENINKEILCLQEYRSILISNVVTGQFDIRDIDIPEYETVEEIETSDEYISDNEMENEEI